MDDYFRDASTPLPCTVLMLVLTRVSGCHYVNTAWFRFQSTVTKCKYFCAPHSVHIATSTIVLLRRAIFLAVFLYRSCLTVLIASSSIHNMDLFSCSPFWMFIALQWYQGLHEILCLHLVNLDFVNLHLTAIPCELIKSIF